ncbi:MAG: hypothetical protein DRH26_02895 [Deltaproteobacteria bacterium]|nr:MAG: hypothetical protein DRH26_02895 [Deltaproteobacteria bacterium]
MTTTQHMPVSSLQAQTECIIRSLGPDEKTAQRLVQMGILPETHLHIIRVTPLDGTIEVLGDQGLVFFSRAPHSGPGKRCVLYIYLGIFSCIH